MNMAFSQMNLSLNNQWLNCLHSFNTIVSILFLKVQTQNSDFLKPQKATDLFVKKHQADNIWNQPSVDELIVWWKC